MQAFVVYTVVLLAISVAIAHQALLRLSPLQDPLPTLLPPPPAASGAFAPNSLLLRSRKIGLHLLPQPEDVAVDASGRIYVACADGWIKRIDPSTQHIQNWTLIDGGRPLGLAMGLHGELIVCEPSMGLLNVTADRIETLSSEAEGVKFKLTDAAAVAKDGSIYFTDATYKYDFATHILDIYEARPHGRLLRYDPATRSTTVLMKDLFFANGVALSNDDRFLVVCETPMARCQRYWLEGEKRGIAEIFIDNLPAFPDNIKNDGKGNFWIGLVSSRSSLLTFALRYPILKHLQLVLGLSKYTSKFFERALVLSVSEEGVPLTNFADPNGVAIRFVTTALVVGDDMYLGNLGEDFLGHLNLNSTN